MRTIYLIIGVLFLFLSCNQTDFKDIESIEKNFPRALENGDEDFVAQLLPDSADNVSLSTQNNIEEIYETFNEKSVSFLKSETSVSDYDKAKTLEMYFQADVEYFRVTSEFNEREFGEKYRLDNIRLTNLSDLCEEYSERLYTPYKFDIKRIQYRFRAGSFKNGKLRVENNTDHDISYVKLRLKLYNENKSSFTPFFNQTIVSEEKIYKGDMANIEIEDLNGYFIDQYDLDLSFSAELLEVRPKPKSEECKTIEELKQL